MASLLESSSHGARNSIKETPLQSSRLISSMTETTRQYSMHMANMHEKLESRVHGFWNSCKRRLMFPRCRRIQFLPWNMRDRIPPPTHSNFVTVATALSINFWQPPDKRQVYLKSNIKRLLTSFERNIVKSPQFLVEILCRR